MIMQPVWRQYQHDQSIDTLMCWQFEEGQPDIRNAMIVHEEDEEEHDGLTTHRSYLYSVKIILLWYDMEEVLYVVTTKHVLER